MNNIVWIRWYKLYADGITPSKDDQYEYQWYHVGHRDADELYRVIEMDLDDSINFFEESEHYRCFRWEYIDKPPQSYIDDQIKWHERSIKHSTMMLNYFKGIKDNE